MSVEKIRDYLFPESENYNLKAVAKEINLSRLILMPQKH